MRIGFRVLSGGEPKAGVPIAGSTPLTIRFGPFPFDLPIKPIAGQTDSNGEFFAVAPLAVGPAAYFLDVHVGGVRIVGLFTEISSYFTVDLDTKKWQRQVLPTRIPGDGYFSPDPNLLKPEELLNVSSDPVCTISNCGSCLYLVPSPTPNKGQCAVNGRMTPLIPIDDTQNTTSRLFYPRFLQPVSPQRLFRDSARLLGGANGGAGSQVASSGSKQQEPLPTGENSPRS